MRKRTSTISHGCTALGGVKIVNKEGTNYSGIRYDIVPNLSKDGSLIYVPQDCIWEIKYENDITGKIQ